MQAPLERHTQGCHDSAACLVRDGAIVAAAQQEGFSRKKHDASFPADAAHSCLDAGGLALGDVDPVVFYDKPLVKANLRFSYSA